MIFFWNSSRTWLRISFFFFSFSRSGGGDTRLSCKFSSNGVFESVVIIHFVNDDWELNIRDLVVIECFRRKAVNRVTFCNGECHDFLVFGYFRLEFFLFCWPQQLRLKKGQNPSDGPQRNWSDKTNFAKCRAKACRWEEFRKKTGTGASPVFTVFAFIIYF